MKNKKSGGKRSGAGRPAKNIFTFFLQIPLKYKEIAKQNNLEKEIIDELVKRVGLAENCRNI